MAVYPPPAALGHLAAAVDELQLGRAAAAGTNVRLAARHRWHLTLAFLGEVSDDRAPEVAPALDAAVARWRAGGGAPPRLRLAGGGSFEGRGSAVVWAGLAGDVAALRKLGEIVRRALRRARLPHDRKPFRPHLTVARPGERLPPDALAADVATLRGYEGPEWVADAVCLVRSQLGPEPVHDRLVTVPLSEKG